MYHFQPSFFYDIQLFIQNSSFLRKYYLLFQSLDLSTFPDQNYGVGRTGYSRHALLRAFIVKHAEQIKSVPQLIRLLDSNPPLTELCGFGMGQLPDESQFYRFLQETKHSLLELIHLTLNKKLIAEKVVSLDTFIMDSKPVMAATRENNFKNPKRNTKNKHNIPTRNLSATLSYYSYQSVDGKKENFIFFWGYRTHVIVSKEGVPLVEVTLPNNVTDATVAKKLIKKLKRLYRFEKGAFFIADAAYDERELYNVIVDQLHGQAFIPINPRNTQENKTFGPHGCPLCDAGLEMKSSGSWTEKLRSRIKFRCPMKASPKISKNYPLGCPIKHPRFLEGKTYGCTQYLDVTHDARAKVPRDSQLFKTTFKLRTEVERYFARLGDREAEQTTHYNIKAIKNQMTIAHLSLSLIAYAAAVLMKQPNKIRCYLTLADEAWPLPLVA